MLKPVVGDTDMKTLLWVLRGDEGYGVESTVCTFSKQLLKQNWHVIAVCLMDGQLRPKLELAGIEVKVIAVDTMPHRVKGRGLARFGLFFKSLKAEQQSTKQIIQLLGNHSITAVETTNMLLLNTVGKVAKKLDALPIWRMANHVKPKSGINFVRLYLQAICAWHGILAMGNSDYTKNTLGFGPANKSANLHGCDSLRFNPENVIPITRNQLGIESSELVFGIIARISDDGDKGQLRFLEALIECDNHGHSICLLIAGGPEDGELAQRIRMLADEHVNIRVLFVGHVEDTERYYGVMDVAVNCRMSPEPFGLSVIEAMMMGVPVLAHSSGGPAETVVHAKTGWLVPDMQIATLATHLSEIIDDRKSWQNMGNNARAHALNSFRIEDEVSRWITQLESNIN